MAMRSCHDYPLTSSAPYNKCISQCNSMPKIAGKPLYKSASQVSVTFPDAIGSLVTCYALATYKSHEHIASTVAYKISFHSSISVLLRHAHDAHPYEVFYSGMHNQGSFQCPLVCLILHVEGKNEQCTIFCTALDPITQSSISLLIKCELCGGI